MVFKMVPSSLPRLSSNTPPPPGCKQWFIRELNMILCVWFESAVKGMFARTCFAYPDKKGSLCVVPFFGSFKETTISRGTADIIVPVILESGCGEHLVMDVNLKEHEDGKYKVWFDFELYLPNGSHRPLDSRSSPRGIHFISQERRDDFDVVDYDDEEFDVSNESEDDVEIDEEDVVEVDVEEVVEDDDEEDEDFELDDYGDYRVRLNYTSHPPCSDGEDDDISSSHPPCSDGEDDDVPPRPPHPPSHILNRWTKKQSLQQTSIPSVPNHTEAIWSDRDHCNLWRYLLELRSLMCLECNGVYDDTCIHLIWRYFSQKALEGTMHFLPSHTKCCKHSGSQLWPISQTIDAWLIQHQHDSYEEFIESTRAFFIEKGML